MLANDRVNFWQNLKGMQLLVHEIPEMVVESAPTVHTLYWIGLSIKMQSISIFLDIKKLSAEYKGCVIRDSYIFWIFFRLGKTVPSFVVVGYVWHFLGRVGFLTPPNHEQQQKFPSWIGLIAYPCQLKDLTLL